jgi:hypothetical protein
MMDVDTHLGASLRTTREVLGDASSSPATLFRANTKLFCRDAACRTAPTQSEWKVAFQRQRVTWPDTVPSLVSEGPRFESGHRLFFLSRSPSSLCFLKAVVSSGVSS